MPTRARLYQGSYLKFAYLIALETLASLAGLVLAKCAAVTAAERDEGRVWREYPDTMIGLRRLENIQACVESVLRSRVPGDLIETGAWRGGACIFMRGLLAAYGVTDRRVFVADSFEGLPRPDSDRYPADAGDQHHKHTFLAVHLEEVKANFTRYALLDDQVVFLKGWFDNTLPSAPINRIAVLRLDGDMYGSTMVALDSLYDKLSPGGFCIIDDFHLPGCRQAVEDYRRKQGITAPMIAIDWAGRYWQK